MLSLCTGKFLAKNINKETADMIQSYSNALYNLMQPLQGGLARDTFPNVHCVGKSWSQVILNHR